MGCYDTVVIRCPKCGEPHYEQTKEGACLLREFPQESVPIDIAVAFNEATILCYCGHIINIEFKGMLPENVALTVT